ncbi:hypothetical protein PLESTM_001031600 [Pleodorina starrii]|nr:hypothetical protein PLESTM_001031600 [Pleodorina starrii]
MKRRKVSFAQRAEIIGSDADASSPTLNYADIKPNTYYLVAMDPKTESHPTAVVKVIRVVPPASLPPPRCWTAMSSQERDDYVWTHSTLEVEWMLRREDTAICKTHRRIPTRAGEDLDPSDTREFVRELPEGVYLPDNLLWLCADLPDPDWTTLRPGDLIRPVRVQWLPPDAQVPPYEEDVFYYQRSYSDRFYRSVYVGPEQRAHQPIPPMPSPLARNAPTPTSPQAQAPAAHTPAAPSPGPLQKTSPPPGPQTPSTLRHGRSTVAQPAANPAHPQSEPGSPPATTPAAAPALAGTALTGTAAGPTDPSFAAATTAAAAARGRMGPAMQRDSAPAAAAPATPSLPLREPTATAAIPTTLSPGSAPGPAPARKRTPMRGGSAEWRVGPKTVPAAVSAAAPAAGLEPRLTGWAASASRRLPPGLRYPAKAEHAGGRELGEEARVVPFLTARRRVPLELAGDRSDAPGLRPRGPCVTAGRGIKGGGPECMGEGRAGGPRVFKVLQLCCGAGCFSLQDWFGPQDDGGSGTGSGDGGGGGGSGGGADGSSGGRSDGRGAGVSSGSGGGSGGLRDLPPLVDCWAVDLNKNACVTFKANNRGADVVRCRVDEYLELVRRYNMLVNWLGIVPPHGQQSEPTAPAPSTAPAGGGFAAAAATAGGGGTSGGRAGGSSGTGTAAVAAGCGAAGSGDGNCCLFDDILAIRVSHCGRFGDNGQLLERLHPGNCWLEVLVQGPSCCDASSSAWQQLLNRFSCPGDPDPRVVWMPVEVLLRGPHASTVNVQLLRDFMAVLLEEDRLPLAGDVFAIMAGTPCQNVCAAVHKEKGAWVRNVYGRLQMLGYQYQLGDIAAGAHGASEGRQRAIVVGTDRGWPPPAFPCPVFEVQSHLKLLSLQVCRPTAVPGQRLMPQPTLHDAISDLDPVSNWKMSPLGRSGSGAVESDGAAALGPVAATAAAGSGDGGTCAGSKDGDVVKGVGANGSPSPLQLAAATAKPPRHTTPRAARLAIAYGLGVFPLARLGRAARDLYDIERRHCLQQLRGASRLNVNTRAMAARAARVHGREGGAHAAGAGMAAAAAGTGAAAADCREREEEEARRRALERIGEVLLGDDGEPGPATESLPPQPTPPLRPAGRSCAVVWIGAWTRAPCLVNNAALQPCGTAKQSLRFLRIRSCGSSGRRTGPTGYGECMRNTQSSSLRRWIPQRPSSGTWPPVSSLCWRRS